MSEAKHPTPQGVSRRLAAAGFQRLTYRKGRVRGQREWTEGFVVGQAPDPGDMDVEVTWWPSSFRFHGRLSRRQLKEQGEMLALYHAVLGKAGYSLTMISELGVLVVDYPRQNLLSGANQ